jgi:hypothetical protein
VGSKYAGLKGKIPEERSERDVAFQTESAKRKDKTIGELTEEYNVVQEALARLAEKTKTGNLLKRVLEVQIREKLDAQDADSINANGYTWTPTFEPYPVAEDVASIVKYFQENGMEDQLQLKASELATRLKSFVKDEALANELIIEIKTEVDPATGEEVEIGRDVRSKIPGVRVFLGSGLSRVKSNKRS